MNEVKEFYKDSDNWSAESYNLQLRNNLLVNDISNYDKNINILDIGCGSGESLKILKDLKYTNLNGIDFSEALLKKAEETTQLNSNRFSLEDLNHANFNNHLNMYDYIFSFGVIGYLDNPYEFLSKIKPLFKKNGKKTFFLHCRNELFNLYTFNRFTKEYYFENFFEDLSKETKEKLNTKLDAILYTEEPKFPDDSNTFLGGPKSKFLNPFKVEEELKSTGFKNFDFYFYNFHAFPPIFKNILGEKVFHEESKKLELDPKNKKGFFMASNFLIKASF